MSYQDQAPSDRSCADCGAPLTTGANFCPECGASQPTYRAAPMARAERRRWWIPAAIVAGAVAAVLGGALLGSALIGQPQGELASASPSPETPESADVDAPSASPSRGQPPPTRSPSASQPSTAAVIPNRAIAEVATDGLNLRAAADENSEALATLERGRRLFIIGKPTDASGLRWYRVAPFDDVEGCEGGCGLIGFVATPVSSGEQPWISAIEVTCPSPPLTAERIGVLQPMEALHCYGREEIEITGTLDLPIHGPISPYRYSPGWLTQESLLFMREAWWVTYRPHPDAGLEEPERGDVVRVTGHFEDPAATDCRVTVDPDFFGGEIPDEFESAILPARVVLDCRTAFVWTDYEVIGFQDLGECCGGPLPSP